PKEAMPEWEQRLSAGAAAMLLLLAAQAMGYGANWITDWCAYDEEAQRLLGLEDGEKIAAFVHIGTVASPPLERARPDPRDLTTHWTPQRAR
ncbi:MAG: nitroreductase family protein, partial [Caulobacteraceae bacterium]